MNVKKLVVMGICSLSLMSMPTLSVSAANPVKMEMTQEESNSTIMPRAYCTFQCNATNVNVRTGPGTSYESITKLQKGEWGYVIDYNTFDTQPTWAKVTFYRESEREHYEGWVYLQYLDLSELRNM